MSEPSLRSLENLAKEAFEGNIQLPKFQRDYKWDKRRTCLLVDSIRRKFPIGGMLALRYDSKIPIKAKPFRSSDCETKKLTITPRELMLDGQQRLTTAMMLLYGVGEYEYYYDIDILFKEWKKRGSHETKEELEKFSSHMTPEDIAYISRRKFPKKLKTPEEEVIAKHILPVKYCKSGDGNLDMILSSYISVNPDRKKFIYMVFKPYFLINPDRIIPIDVITDNSLEALTRIFSTLNKTGLALTPYEIAISQLATSTIDPREDREVFNELYPFYKHLDEEGDLLLQTILFFADEDHSKNAMVTKLKESHYRIYSEEVVKRLDWVGETLKDKVGIPLDRSSEFLVYPNIAIPMAWVIRELDDKFGLKKKYIVENWKNKFAIWWLTGVLTRKYQQGYYSTHRDDKSEFFDWIGNDGPKPKWLESDPIEFSKLVSKAPGSAAGKAFSAYLSSRNLTDPYTKKHIGFTAAEATQVHHIYPKTLKAERDIPKSSWKEKYNYFLNTMLISGATNSLFKNKEPREQIDICLTVQSESDLRLIYKNQFINEKCWEILFSGEFTESKYDAFIEARAECFAEHLESNGYFVNKSTTSKLINEDEDDDE